MGTEDEVEGRHYGHDVVVAELRIALQVATVQSE